MISELREVHEYDPLHIPQLTHLEWVCIGLTIALLISILIPMIFHGHVFDFGMGSDVWFSEGHRAYGDPSLFGPDGFHFRGE